jgi:hypothetical protein
MNSQMFGPDKPVSLKHSDSPYSTCEPLTTTWRSAPKSSCFFNLIAHVQNFPAESAGLPASTSQWR